MIESLTGHVDGNTILCTTEVSVRPCWDVETQRMGFILSRPEVEGDVPRPVTEEAIVAVMSHRLVTVYNDIRGIRRELTDGSFAGKDSSPRWNHFAAQKAASNLHLPPPTNGGETLRVTVIENEGESPWTRGVELVSNVPRIHAELWLRRPDYMCLRVSHRRGTRDPRSLSEIEGEEYDSLAESSRFSEELLKRLTAREGFPAVPEMVEGTFASRLEAVQNTVCPVIRDRLKAMTTEANGPFSGCAAFFEDISSHNLDDDEPQSLSVATIRASKLDRQPGEPFVWVRYPPPGMALRN